MSFADVKATIEATVIQPLLDFHTKTAPLNQIHNDCMQHFSNIMAGLLTGSDGGIAMQGSGSMALADITGSILQSEQSLSGSGADYVGHLLEAAQAGEKIAHQLQQQLDSIAAQQDHTVENVAGFAGAVDAGAVAQGGFDVPWDVVAVGVTLVAGAIALTHNADQAKVQQAQAALAVAEREWTQAMSTVIGDPLPQLPPSPKKPNGDSSDFLKKLGIGVGIGITIAVVLASLEKLTEEFPDIPPDVIATLLEQGLTEKQVRDILKKLLAGGMTPDQIRQSLQKLIALGLSQEQIAKFYKSHAKDIPAIWAAYLQVSHIPGIDRVLYPIADGSKTDYQGYVFELNWIVANQAEIARVEATDPSNKAAADIILTDGTVIEAKSYNWQSQANLDALMTKIGKDDKTTIQRILKQIQRYKREYPGEEIIYYFDSADGRIPEDLAKIFKNAGVEVKYWPDPDPTKTNPNLGG
ncbi:MAG: hypothetical protein M3Z08_02810 [Chloroflexota bacterium]|nr:hypothetical protein [Chloroflexota bacterium]